MEKEQLVAGISDYSPVSLVTSIEFRHWSPRMIFFFTFTDIIVSLVFYEDVTTVV